MMNILFRIYFHNLGYPISQIFFLSFYSSVGIRRPCVCLSLSGCTGSVWKLETIGWRRNSDSDIPQSIYTHTFRGKARRIPSGWEDQLTLIISPSTFNMNGSTVIVPSCCGIQNYFCNFCWIHCSRISRPIIGNHDTGNIWPVQRSLCRPIIIVDCLYI
ncbi:MAG: hypothetical protein ACD_78C00064G0001 [uncultured bacterium (gcode 4)]|uniref:Uncharacterized protein n=1 Tax=uncultured bacterium (gcode 4) TaxID=1234023 RepID=K1XZ29_9BACT|nr:MAG: hypothetical protein ACD_78C00064G0001 [uncultured bacterium (gcode 4)]